MPTVASVVAASSATDNCGTPTITAVAGAITGTRSQNTNPQSLLRMAVPIRMLRP
ncbi:MAG: hypothetical protein IPN89_17455 [Saprospiraceae bacterium]|nr:hypothetical protein [Saprospiraceae bacterium]